MQRLFFLFLREFGEMVFPKTHKIKVTIFSKLKYKTISFYFKKREIEKSVEVASMRVTKEIGVAQSLCDFVTFFIILGFSSPYRKQDN